MAADIPKQADGVSETVVAEIARRHLNLDTLETRRSDALDFHTLSIWSIREALVAAFNAGAASAACGRKDLTMTRYADLNDAMFDPRLIGNRPALDILHSLPADQRYVIEVGPAAGQGTELRIWRLDLAHATGPVATREPDIRFNLCADATEAPE